MSSSPSSPAPVTRCRFAPSPTGFFHIGSARTALFNWLFARHTGGTFILRIEDTDQERNRDEYLELIYASLRWLGLDWDEGPHAGGSHGPYRQSERGDIYRRYLARLHDTGRAYEKDGATWFRIEGERYEHFDPHRQRTVTKVRTPPTVIDDAIRGRVERIEDEDFVIVRSDGQPVFHFVNVVDDIDMRITHVIRGEDHLSNTSKHVELFRAFGVTPPVFAHIPLILKSDGPGKMSKRDKGALIEEYIRRGFLPEAVRNYLCLLGWSPKDDREMLAIDEVIRLFDLPAVLRSNARFDERKMNHLNSLYLAALPAAAWLERARATLAARSLPPPGTDDAYVDRVLLLCREKLSSLEQVPDFTACFWTDDYPIDPGSLAKIRGKHDLPARLAEITPALAAATDFSAAALEQAVAALAASRGLKPAEYIHTTRLAVSGSSVGPSFYGLLEVLGRERVLARLAAFPGRAAAAMPQG